MTEIDDADQAEDHGQARGGERQHQGDEDGVGGDAEDRSEQERLRAQGGRAARLWAAPGQSGSDLQAASLGCTEGSAMICSNMSLTPVQPGRTRMR